MEGTAERERKGNYNSLFIPILITDPHFQKPATVTVRPVSEF